MDKGSPILMEKKISNGSQSSLAAINMDIPEPLAI